MTMCSTKKCPIGIKDPYCVTCFFARGGVCKHEEIMEEHEANRGKKK